jgi:hypothetical protein
VRSGPPSSAVVDTPVGRSRAPHAFDVAVSSSKRFRGIARMPDE